MDLNQQQSAAIRSRNHQPRQQNTLATTVFVKMVKTNGRVSKAYPPRQVCGPHTCQTLLPTKNRLYLALAAVFLIVCSLQYTLFPFTFFIFHNDGGAQDVIFTANDRTFSKSKDDESLSQTEPKLTSRGKYLVSSRAVLTYASAESYESITNLIVSVQIWAPGLPVVIVDMGLSENQRSSLLQNPGVSFEKFDHPEFSNMYFQDLNSFSPAWKPLIIAKLLKKYDAVIVQDAEQEFRHSLTIILNLLKDDGYFFVKQTRKKRVSLSAHSENTKIATMVRYISVFKSQEYFLSQFLSTKMPNVASTSSGWVRNSPAHLHVLLPALECAQKMECTSQVEDHHYIHRLIHYAGLNVQEAGKYWADSRTPWYLTDNPLESNDIVFYNRRHQCPKPYTPFHNTFKSVLNLNKDDGRNDVQHGLEQNEQENTNDKHDTLGKNDTVSTDTIQGCHFQDPNEQLNRHSLSSMKNYYKGERAWLIGNAPSLSRLPMHLLQNEFTLSFNRFYMFNDRISWRPNMYMCIDTVVCPDIADDINLHINSYRHAFFPWTYRDKKTTCDYTDYIHDNRRIQWMEFEKHEGEPEYESREDAFKVKTRGTVASVGLEVLSHLGFSEIIVIGVDMDYAKHKNVKSISHLSEDIEGTENNDSNHFDPRYFGVGKKFHAPRANLYMLPSFLKGVEIVNERAMQTANCHLYTRDESCGRHDNCYWNSNASDVVSKCFQFKPEIQLYNAGYGGLLPEDQIERKDFRSFFQEISLSDEFQIFLKGLSVDFQLPNTFNLKAHSLVEMIGKDSDLIVITSAKEFANKHAFVVAPESLAIQLIPLTIYTHILRGPIDGAVILISRSLYNKS